MPHDIHDLLTFLKGKLKREPKPFNNIPLVLKCCKRKARTYLSCECFERGYLFI